MRKQRRPPDTVCTKAGGKPSELDVNTSPSVVQTQRLSRSSGIRLLKRRGYKAGQEHAIGKASSSHEIRLISSTVKDPLKTNAPTELLRHIASLMYRDRSRVTRNHGLLDGTLSRHHSIPLPRSEMDSEGATPIFQFQSP